MPDSDATHRGRSLEELTTPRLIAMPPPDIVDGTLLEIESTLRRTVPQEIRKRIGVSRNLVVYGAFCYDFAAVSVLWSLTCIEMALWEKFAELNPGPLTVTKKGSTETVSAAQLASRLQGSGRIVGMPNFNGSFRSLVNWATEQRLVADAEWLDAMVKLRNSFAHPKEFSPVLTPGMAVTVFQRTVETANHFWPLDTL